MRLRKDFASHLWDLSSLFYDSYVCPYCGKTGPPWYDQIDGQTDDITCPSCRADYRSVSSRDGVARIFPARKKSP